MSRNPPQRDFHQILMEAMGIRAYKYNLQNIGSPNAISPPIAIDKNLTKKRNEIDPYFSIKTDVDYSAIQNTVRGLADEIIRFDDLEHPSNEINNPRSKKTEQALEM